MTASDRDKIIEVMARGMCRVLCTQLACPCSKWQRYIAECGGAFDHLQAEGMAVVPVAHLEPFAKYYRSRMDVPMRGMDDCIHAIHRGTEWEAEISVSDCGRLAAALPTSKE